MSAAKYHPTIELDSQYAYLRLHADGIFTPLRFEWALYPEAFAMYMGFLQPQHVEVTRLRLVEHPDAG